MGVKYKVKYREMDGYHGTCDYTKCELCINNTHDIQRQQKTLIHEIVHAFLHEAGLEELNEEKHVQKLETAIYDLLKNNDFGWLQTKEKREQK